MRKSIVLMTVLCAGLALAGETEAEKTARMAWWTQSRFGMFIHFGLYSLPARHEWVQANERIPPEKYAQYMQWFDPDRFDAKVWARAARAAGMKYVVLTSKHHEGFCLWDSAYTDYKITKTPFGRDLVREFVDAVRAEGLRVGFYYSLEDWHHPDYTVDSVHPLRPARFKGVWEMKGCGVEIKPEMDKLNAGRDLAKYRQYMKNQVTELLTKYGKIDLLWYDWTIDDPGLWCKSAKDWDAEGLLALTRKLQPGIIVNDRLGLGKVPGGWDFVTPEQDLPHGWAMRDGKKVPWETCQTFSGSWGYYRDEHTWKSPKQLVDLLVRTVSFGGNLLMNVGPTGRGNFDRRAVDALAVYGRWMAENSRAIYGCTQAPDEFKAPEGTLLTWNPETSRLYIHILDYRFVPLACPFIDKVAHAQFLHDASEIQLDWKKRFKLPVPAPDVVVPVIEAILKP